MMSLAVVVGRLVAQQAGLQFGHKAERMRCSDATKSIILGERPLDGLILSQTGANSEVRAEG